MNNARAPHVRILTVTSWLTIALFALTSTFLAVSLQDIARDFGISYRLQGALSPVRSAALAVAAFTCGYAADRIGKRWLMGIAMFLVAGGVLAMAASSSYGALVGAVLVLGMGLGGVEGLVSPLAAELHPRSVATHLNVLHAFYPTGVMLCAGIAGVALRFGVGWRHLFTAAAIPIGGVGVVYLFCRFPAESPEERRAPIPLAVILRNPVFWGLAAIMMLTAGSEGSLTYWGPSLLQREYGSSALVGGMGLAVFGATMAAGRFGASGVVRFVRIEALMLGMALLGALCTLGLVTFNSERASVALMAASGLFCAAFWPSVLSLANEKIAARSSTLLAMISVAGIVGFGGIPSLVGWFAEISTGGLRSGMSLVPMCFGLAGLFLIPVFRARTRVSAPVSDEGPEG